MTTKRHTSLARLPLALAVISTLYGPQLFAQAAQAPQDEQREEREATASGSQPKQLEAVRVVGSRIKRAEIEGPAPVTVISREEIDREGEIGEWSFGIRYPKLQENLNENSDWVKALICLIECRVSASEAAKRVSQYFGVAKNLVYDRALKISGKK